MLKKRRTPLFVYTAICLFTYGCKHRDFPPVKDLSTYNKTSFITTPESRLQISKNNIYASSLLYAWGEIRDQLQPLSISDQFNDLRVLNASNSYQHSLHADEVEKNVAVNGEWIKVSAAFKKSLPLPYKLDRLAEPFLFNNEQVEAFGFKGDNKNIASFSKILFHNSDSDFAISLLPKDRDHEIILYMPGTDTLSSFQDLLAALRLKIKTAKINEFTGKNYSDNFYEAPDVVEIPVIQFSIETHYKKLEGSSFQAGGQNYTISIAQQRTAFIIDELGAEVESKSTIEIVGASAGGRESAPVPKKLIFNKPFLILLKRKDSEEPYFMAWIANTELMEKK